MYSGLGLLLSIAAALALVSAPMSATLASVSGTSQTRQSPPTGEPQEQDEPPITLGAELVLLDVSVADRAGRPLMSLDKERFQVLEDGVPQEIQFFSRGDAPASIVLALDTSGSMRPKLRYVSEAAKRILDGARPGDEFAVIEFRVDANLTEEFTADTADIRDALADLQATGQTAMIDAAHLAADYAQREGKNRLKAVVLVTDGVDKNSYYSFRQLAEQLRRLDVRLYVIGFTADLDRSAGLFNKSERRKAEDLLKNVARETGGQSFFPTKLEQLTGINEAISEDLRAVYSIGYYSTNQKKDGTYRTVEVKVVGPDGRADGDIAVRTRTGYVAGRS